ncbi:secreted protein, partial [Rhodopirellula maiorica SM1]
MSTNHQPRREFLKSAAGAAAILTPWASASHSLAADRSPDSSERLNLGLIGAGGIAKANVSSSKSWLNLVAIADVDATHRAAFNKRHAGGKAKLYEDYR